MGDLTKKFLPLITFIIFGNSCIKTPPLLPYSQLNHPSITFTYENIPYTLENNDYCLTNTDPWGGIISFTITGENTAFNDILKIALPVTSLDSGMNIYLNYYTAFTFSNVFINGSPPKNIAWLSGDPIDSLGMTVTITSHSDTYVSGYFTGNFYDPNTGKTCPIYDGVFDHLQFIPN